MAHTRKPVEEMSAHERMFNDMPLLGTCNAAPFLSSITTHSLSRLGA
jgi:hypothetical protein